jgi:hypothetical protein
MEEAAGFYGLRYIWNRLEERGHGHDTQPTIFEIIAIAIKLLLGLGPSRDIRDAFNDYFKGHTELKFPMIEYKFAGRDAIQVLYSAWLRKNPPQELRRSGETTELSDADLDAVRAELSVTPQQVMLLGQQESAEPSFVVDPELRRGAPTASAAPDWLPGRDFDVPEASKDHYIRGIRSRFEVDSIDFPVLDRDTTRTVTIGHTHRPCGLELFGEPGLVFFNSGSWTKGQRVTPYVWSYSDGSAISSGLRAAFRQEG